MLNTHILCCRSLLAHKLPPQPSKTVLNFGLWWAVAQRTHIRQSNRDSHKHTDPYPHYHHTHPPTHTLLHSDLSFLSPTHIPPVLPPLSKKTKNPNHLPSFRKFLMISIISVRALSPAKSQHVHAHTQQTRTQSI